jgi:hypothetical protein
VIQRQPGTARHPANCRSDGVTVARPNRFVQFLAPSGFHALQAHVEVQFRRRRPLAKLGITEQEVQIYNRGYFHVSLDAVERLVVTNKNLSALACSRRLHPHDGREYIDAVPKARKAQVFVFCMLVVVVVGDGQQQYWFS